VSPDDQQTKDEARIVHPVFEARLERLAAMRGVMAGGLLLTDEMVRKITEMQREHVRGRI
jgi:hypothetical protein